MQSVYKYEIKFRIVMIEHITELTVLQKYKVPLQLSLISTLTVTTSVLGHKGWGHVGTTTLYFNNNA